MDEQKNGKKYEMIFDRVNCIGAGACAAANPTRWEIKEDGLASIIGEDVERNPESKEERVKLSEEEFQDNLNAAEACPVRVIKLRQLETGKMLFE